VLEVQGWPSASTLLAQWQQAPLLSYPSRTLWLELRRHLHHSMARDQMMQVGSIALH
jgi:hypothetical protein